MSPILSAADSQRVNNAPPMTLTLEAALAFRPPPGLELTAPPRAGYRGKCVSWGNVEMLGLATLREDMDAPAVLPTLLSPTNRGSLSQRNRNGSTTSTIELSDKLPMPANRTISVSCQPPVSDAVHTSRQMADCTPSYGDDFANGNLTTVMLQNLPGCYDRSMLLALLDSCGFFGSYDFVYLPLDFKTGHGLGYAFVNFVTHDSARIFFDVFTGFRNWGCATSKVGGVIWRSKHQGFQDNVEIMRNSTVMHSEIPECFQPAIFLEGVRVAFPCPTKRISVARAVINSCKSRVNSRMEYCPM